MIRETEELLNGFCKIGKTGMPYLMLNGNDHKIWLIPCHSVKSGLQIYQPASLKGRIVKRFLPYMVWCIPLLKTAGIFRVGIQWENAFYDVVSEAFGQRAEGLEYAIYTGDTRFAENRKIVVQFAALKTILGYGKFSDDPVACAAFERETDILGQLAEKRVTGIPSIRWKGKQATYYGFIQTTEKEGNEPVVKELTSAHWNFLCEIRRKTIKEVPFQGSQFALNLQEFYKMFSCSNWSRRTAILSGIQWLNRYYSDHPLRVSLFHGDFTPWNVCVKKKHIFVFDFEYAEKEYPEGMDAFHFLTQVGIISENLTAQQIFEKFQKNKEQFASCTEWPALTYMCYLIHILGFYFKRWNQKLKETERSCNIWLDLLEKCYLEVNQKGI